MNIVTLDAPSASSTTYSVATGGLDIGPEVDWDPEHLALSAWLEHVPFAFWLMKVLRPACFVELGTERGVSYAAFCQAVDRLGLGSRCYAVDTWRGDAHAGHYDESVFHTVSAMNDRRYRRFSSLLRMTFAEALAYFADGEVDLLHIDGLHTYEAAAEDFRTWRPKLSDQAVVLFHDTNVRRDDFGVWRLWRELTMEYPHFEFVHGHGLGVVGVGTNLPAPAQALFDCNLHVDRRLAVRGFFAARGAAVQRAYDLRCESERAAGLSAELMSRDAKIVSSTYQAEAASRQAEAASYRAAAASYQAQAEANRIEAASLQAQITSLRNEMAVTSSAAKLLRKQWDETAAEVAYLNTRLVAEARREALIEATQTAEMAAGNTIADLEAQLAAAEAKCAAFKASTCWRITAPLRAVKMAAVKMAGARPRAIAGPRDGSARRKNQQSDTTQDPQAANPSGSVAANARERILPPASHARLLRPRVLIVAELTLPQCKKYRVDQKHDMIEALGWDCSVVAWQNTEQVLMLMQTHSLVIFYRVPAFPEVLRIIREADSLGLPHYFELDDLIFDLDDYAGNPNLIGLDPATTKGLFDGARLYRQALELCRDVIASTPYLGTRMHAVGGGSSVVIENALDAETMRAATTPRPHRQDGNVRIIYGSGTRTHDADFSLIADALRRVVAEHGNVEIVIVGDLTPPRGLLDASARLRRLPACPYPQYLALVADSDIAIAPLVPGNFNEAKSNIKFLEAASVGVPSVCSPRSAFVQAIRHGETGFLAETSDDWYAALTSLVADPALRLRMGQAARHDVLQRYSPDAIGRRQVRPLLSKYQPAADPRLHVLQVNILCGPQTFGGATVVMEEMSRALNDRADTRVSILTSAPAGWIKPYGIERGEIFSIPVFRIGIQDNAGWMQAFWDENAGEVFREVLRGLRPDVVHFHAIQGIGAACLTVCREEGIPFVVTLHDAWWVCERQFLVTGEGRYCGQKRINANVCATCVADIGVTVLRNLRLRQALEGAAVLLTPSQHWRRFHIANGFAPDRVIVNENGIPLPAAPTPNQGPARLRFGFVAGAEAVKGFPLLKRTFEALDRDDWELVLVNHGLSMGVDSYAGIKWNARGTVRTVPPFKATARDSFYDQVDVLLFPSQWPESFGLTVREAMVRNKWVIATDQGGAAEAIRPGVNGTLIPIGDDIGPLRKAVEDLLDRKLDLAGWVNPFSDRIRDFHTQAAELRGILGDVASAGHSQPTAMVAAVA